MIIKGFFRKATTRVYVILLITIITIVGILNSSSLVIKDSMNNIYYNTHIFTVDSGDDSIEKLSNDDRIDNVRRTILFESVDTDQLVDDDYNKNNPLSWTALSYYSLNTIFTYKDDKNTLIENDIALGLDSLSYSNISNIIDKYIGKTIRVLYKDVEYDFVIKEVYDSGLYAEFKISSDLFNKFIENENTYLYSSKVKKEEYASQIENDYSIYIKTEDDRVSIGTSYSTFNDNARYDIYEQYETEYNNLVKAIYVLYVLFIIMLIIISKNILEDMEINIKLEGLLGFNKKNIRINILKRLFSLTFINIILSIILSIIVSLVMNNFYDYNLLIFNYSYYLKITVILILLNILMLLFTNNKLNIYSRKKKI